MKKKKKIIILIISITFIITLTLYLKNKISFNETKTTNKMVALIETGEGTGIYQTSSINTWPTTGYKYNESKSYCLNGSNLTYNKASNQVSLSLYGFDKCYVYFDVYNPDIYIESLTLNKVSTNSYPAKSNLVGVNVTCTNADCKWDYDNWRLLMSNVTGKITTSIAFNTITSKEYLNNKIIGLSGTTQGDGQVVNENGYRYEGNNPNNYVWFNGESWRIIGVFGSAVHGQSSNLVKLIKEDSIGGLVYSTARGINSWGASTLYNLLNNYYYHGTDYTNKANGTYCSSYYGYTPGNCLYSKTGIQTNARNMIQNVNWYSTAFSSIGTADVTYGYDTTTTTSSAGYIGLMYASDYGYAPLASICARTIILDSYDGSTNGLTCAGQNWLKLGEYEWTLSRRGSDISWSVNNIGYVYSYDVYRGYAQRPVLYLKSNVYFVSGTGTKLDPYIVAI